MPQLSHQKSAFDDDAAEVEVDIDAMPNNLGSYSA